MQMKGEDLWNDFITAFRPETIELVNRKTQLRWSKFLRDNGVYVGTSRKKQISHHLIEVLYSKRYCPTIAYEEKRTMDLRLERLKDQEQKLDLRVKKIQEKEDALTKLERKSERKLKEEN